MATMPLSPGASSSAPRDNDDRWSLVWHALIIYYTFDSIFAFFLSLASFIANLIYHAIVSAAGPSACPVSQIMFILSGVTFATRFIDMVLGCCTLGCWCCGGGDAKRDRALLGHIRNCILICGAQCGLALASIVVAIYGMVQFGEECMGSIVSIVFALLLLADAGWELFIWIGAYWMRLNQHQIAIPKMVDNLIPTFLYDWARKHRL